PIPHAAPPKAEGSAVRASASSALPLAPPAPDASPLPIAPVRRATPEAAVNFDEPVTVPMNARQQAVLLPLQAPSTGPVINPVTRPSAPASPPPPTGSDVLPAVPDHTPAARVDVPAPDEPAQRAPSPSLTPWFGSLRMLALIGGAITVVLIVAAIVLLGGPSSSPT